METEYQNRGHLLLKSIMATTLSAAKAFWKLLPWPFAKATNPLTPDNGLMLRDTLAPDTDTSLRAASEMLRETELASVDSIAEKKWKEMIGGSKSHEPQEIFIDVIGDKAASEMLRETELASADSVEFDPSAHLTRKKVTPNDVPLINPNSDAHKKRMNRSLANNNIAGNDSIMWMDKNTFFRHLNAELYETGSKFMLGNKFFEENAELSRKDENRFTKYKSISDVEEVEGMPKYDPSALPEHIADMLKNENDDEKKMFLFLEKLWPGSAFADAVAKAKYASIPDEYRIRLLNSIAIVHGLQKELEELHELQASGSLLQEQNDRMNQLEIALGAMSSDVTMPGNMCMAGIVAAIQSLCYRINSLCNSSATGQSPNDIIRQTRAQFRGYALHHVQDTRHGTLFNRNLTTCYDRKCYFGTNLWNGSREEYSTSIEPLLSNVMGLNTPNNTAADDNASDVLLEEVIHDLADALRFGTNATENSYIASVAKDTFRKLNGETSDATKNEDQGQSVTFEEFCAQNRMNASEKREEIMEKIKASAANEKDAMAKANLILLLHWMNEINGDMSPIGEIEDLRVALIDKTKFINEAMPYAKDIDIKPLNDQLQLLEHAIKILNPPISWTAKEIFNGLNDETFDAVKNKLLEASITFGEFCYIRDIDTNELRKTLMKKIAATPTDSAIDKAN